MSNPFGRVVLALALITTLAAMCASAAGASDQRGRYVVVLKGSVDRPGAVAQAQTQRLDGDLKAVFPELLNGYAAILPSSEVDALRSDPRVAYVTLDHKVSLFEEEGGEEGEELELETEANEGLEVSEATIPTGISRTFAATNKALSIDGKDNLRADVDVAVIDSGIDYEHPDLNVVARTSCISGTCIDNTGTDVFTHGTHVAGTIGAIDNGVGVTGIAPGARLWAVKVFNDGGGSFESWLIKGVEWVTAHASDIEVANISAGCVCSMPALDTAINKSVETGVVYAVAAGNLNLDAKSFSPANNTNVITVSALADYDGKSGAKGSPSCENYGLDDRKASFSNYGTAVEIVAPGVCILSTEPGNKYGVKSGTSMASPHVAGAAAILASQANPNSKKDVETIREALIKAGNSGWTDTSVDGVTEPLLDLSNEATFALPRWALVATPNASGAEHSELHDMACDPESTSACTAVGLQISSGGVTTPYAQYWNGKTWANQSTATPEGATKSQLLADHCISKTSCVAAGSYTTESGTFSLAESWNGTSWSVQTTPNPAGATETMLRGVSCKAITACIGVGYGVASGKQTAFAMLGNSGTWSLQTVPMPAGGLTSELNGVECTSTTSCVAVGRYTVSGGAYWAMAAAWNGTEWALQTVPKPSGAKKSILLDLSCSDATHCTAIGAYVNASNVQVTFVQRWNGTSWSLQTSPNPVGSANSVLQNVFCAENSWCVAVGDWYDGKTWHPMAHYWNGTTWSLETVPSPSGSALGLLDGVSCRVTCLAVGFYTDAGGKNKTLGETGI